VAVHEDFVSERSFYSVRSVIYNGPPLFPQNCPCVWGNLEPRLILLSLAHTTQHPKRHLDRFSRFCTAHDRDGPTDGQTRYSVCNIVDRIYVTY